MLWNLYVALINHFLHLNRPLSFKCSNIIYIKSMFHAIADHFRFGLGFEDSIFDFLIKLEFLYVFIKVNDIFQISAISDNFFWCELRAFTHSFFEVCKILKSHLVVLAEDPFKMIPLLIPWLIQIAIENTEPFLGQQSQLYDIMNRYELNEDES